MYDRTSESVQLNYVRNTTVPLEVKTLRTSLQSRQQSSKTLEAHAARLTVITKYWSDILICQSLLTGVGLKKLMGGSLIGPLFPKPLNHVITRNGVMDDVNAVKLLLSIHHFFFVLETVIINYATV